MAEWEKVKESGDYVADKATWRLAVEGGWLYRYDHSLQFVPVKDTTSLAGTGTPNHKNVFPTMHKEAPTRITIPTGKGVEDAEYEEVSPKEVNGSEVITARRVS